jgi:hypothetical protein
MAKHAARGLRPGIRLLLAGVAIVATVGALSAPDERRRLARARGRDRFPGRHRAVRPSLSARLIRQLAGS